MQLGQNPSQLDSNRFFERFSIETINKNHLFGLGVAEGLKGNFVVLDGKFLKTTVLNTFLKTDTIAHKSVSNFVYTNVLSWKIGNVTAQIDSLEQLVAFIESYAQSQGLPKQEPFVFMLRLHINNIDYQVIDWPKDEAFEPMFYNQYAHLLHETDTGILLLGFLWPSEINISTNQKSKYTVYAVTETQKPALVGALTGIEVKGNIEVYLPQNQLTNK